MTTGPDHMASPAAGEPHSLARRLLSRALERGRLSHAYLFAGPEGAGKRTLARAFAAALVCERRSFPPCGACDPCGRVDRGVHPDVAVVEPEGRSIKIDPIRELSTRLQYHSFEGGRKAGLIIEAERMTEPAQNAFLKTLEEPTPDTVLILTAANLSRLLPTIISRCQVLRLGPLPESVIAGLVTKELGLDPEPARLLASLAQGNARRALDLEPEFVVDFRRQFILELLALDKDDRVSILDFAERMAKEAQSEAALDLLAGFYRDVLHLKLGRDLVWNRDLAEQAAREARINPLGRLIELLEAIQTARTRALGNAHPRLNWEILTMTLRGVEGAELKPT